MTYSRVALKLSDIFSCWVWIISSILALGRLTCLDLVSILLNAL